MKFEFYTSVSGTAFWNGLVRDLKIRGQEVEVISVMQEQAYRRPRNIFSKLLMRWKLYAGMSLHTRRHISSPIKQPTCRIATTNPFFLPELVREKTSPSADVRIVNLVFDLYPEAIQLSGRQISPGTQQRLESITSRSIERCHASVFLGERIQKYALGKYGTAPKTTVIPVGADAQSFASTQPEYLGTDHPVRFLYCGVLGRMHEVDTLAQLGCGETLSDCEWHIHATGKGVRSLRGSWFQVRGPLSSSTWPSAMKAAQVGVVSMLEGSEMVVLPSKTFSALAAGQAILAICPKDSDLADLVLKHNCGWVVAPGDVKSLRLQIQNIVTNRDELLAKRSNAYKVGQGIYSSDMVADKWVALGESLFE